MNGVEGWVLIKRGLYWRPDAQGYTGLKSEAGAYSDEYASAYAEHGEGTTKMKWADAPLLSPSCSDESARKYYVATITDLSQKLERTAHTLMVVQCAIDEDTTALNDCLWIPERFGPNESVLDFVGSALSALNSEPGEGKL